jgi:hypothetical protein
MYSEGPQYEMSLRAVAREPKASNPTSARSSTKHGKQLALSVSILKNSAPTYTCLFVTHYTRFRSSPRRLRLTQTTTVSLIFYQPASVLNQPITPRLLSAYSPRENSEGECSA